MEPAQIFTWGFGAIGALAGLLYIEEWWRHRCKEMREDAMKGRRTVPATPTWWRKYLPLVTVVCCVCFMISVLVLIQTKEDKGQKSPTAPHSLPPQQWYLKIKSVECVPAVGNSKIVPAFRIESFVNGHIYSFPLDTMFYMGITNQITTIDSVILPQTTDGYSVQFLTMNLERQLFITGLALTNDITLSNIIKSTSPQIDHFSISNLPAITTNCVQMVRPRDHQLKIIYEITGKE